FGGGQQLPEFRTVHIEVFMVESLLHLIPDQGSEFGQIHHKTRIGVHLPPDPYLKVKIMPVKTLGVALAKNSKVPLLAPIGIVQPVGCVEMGLSANGDNHNAKQAKTFLLMGIRPTEIFI